MHTIFPLTRRLRAKHAALLARGNLAHLSSPHGPHGHERLVKGTEIYL